MSSLTNQEDFKCESHGVEFCDTCANDILFPPISNCHNYELCNGYYSDKTNGLCFKCATANVDILTRNPSIDCPICTLDNLKGVKMPNCEHYICNDCFKTCYYPETDNSTMPKFPIDDKEKEDKYEFYFTNVEEIIDLKPTDLTEEEYQLIIRYHHNCTIWNYNKVSEECKMKRMLQRCPLCRL